MQAFYNGNWIQVNRNTGTEKIMDPFGQAAEAEPDAMQASLPGTRKSVLKLLKMENAIGVKNLSFLAGVVL